MTKKQHSFETAFLKADFKRLDENLNELKQFLKEHAVDDRRNFDRVVRLIENGFKSRDKRLVHLEKKLDMWAFGINIVKFFVAAIIALLTFKFGDISRLWATIVGGN